MGDLLAEDDTEAWDAVRVGSDGEASERSLDSSKIVNAARVVHQRRPSEVPVE